MKKLGKLLLWGAIAAVWYEAWVAYQEVDDILDRESELQNQVDDLQARVDRIFGHPPQQHVHFGPIHP